MVRRFNVFVFHFTSYRCLALSFPFAIPALFPATLTTPILLFALTFSDLPLAHSLRPDHPNNYGR